MTHRQPSWITAAAGLGLAAAAFAAPHAAPEVLQVPTYAGLEVLHVDVPDQAASPARPAVGLSRSGVETLFSRVIVRADADALKQAGVKAQPVAGLPGFHVIEAGSVRAAAALAANLGKRPGVAEAYVDGAAKLEPRQIPTDPALPLQWHLMNQLPESDPTFDINADAAWVAGYTGAGVVVGVIDGGYHLTHPDLADNHVLEASTEGTAANNHGTNVAGVIAAVGNNGQGGAGVAFEAGLARLYYNGGSQAIAEAFLHRNDLISVKNSSWGPSDNGIARVMASVERAAIEQSVLTGRGGKGEIFVWAGGNGALSNDRADYDPYTTNRFTISVGAIDSSDQASIYSEPGSCILICAPSDTDVWSSSDVGIYTTHSTSGYTPHFGGTSAAAPIVSGVVALMLDANPCLTWRDVQHILVESARQNDPLSPGWTTNGANRYIHERYGFGAVDAGAATATAASWPGLPPEVTISSPVSFVGAPLPDNNPSGVSRQIVINDPLTIESVEVTIDVVHPRVGDLSVVLTSPAGTESVFALPRWDFGADYNDYLFTSMRHWGEPSVGAWTLKVADETSSNEGAWLNWRITLNGSEPGAVACPCEWDASSGIDVFDLLGYLDDWFTQDAAADLNCSETVDVFDLLAYLDCWFGGCQ